MCNRRAVDTLTQTNIQSKRKDSSQKESKHNKERNLTTISTTNTPSTQHHIMRMRRKDITEHATHDNVE